MTKPEKEPTKPSGCTYKDLGLICGDEHCDICDEGNSITKQHAEDMKEMYELDEEKIALLITNYFILEKRWLQKRGRTILFDEGDSTSLAKALSNKLPEILKVKGGEG